MTHAEMIKLIKEDPEEFERVRLSLIENVITSAPENQQLKLRAIQAKWDKTMKGAGSKENRFVFAKDMLITQFLEVFNPKLKECSERIDKIWKK